MIEIDSSNKDVTIRFLTPMKSKRTYFFPLHFVKRIALILNILWLARRGKFELLEGDFEEEEIVEEVITTSVRESVWNAC